MGHVIAAVNYLALFYMEDMIVDATKCLTFLNPLVVIILQHY